MKKTISILLCMLMICGVFAASGLLTVSAYMDDDIYAYDVDRTKTKVCVSVGATYTLKLDGASVHNAFANDGKKLTDGKTSPSADGNYVGTKGAGTVTVTLDLGRKIPGLADFEVHAFVQNGLKASLPVNFRLDVSDDGSDYVQIKHGSGAIPEDPSNNTAYTLKYSIKDGVIARYIRYTLITGDLLLFDEVSAYTFGVTSDVTADGSGYKDTKGMVYSINKNAHTASVLSYTDSYTTTTVVSTPKYSLANETGNDENADYYIGKGATDIGANGVRVIADFIPEGRENRPGLWVSQKRYVVMHNTGNYSYGATAYANNRYQVSNPGSISSIVSYHYCVGNDGIYQGLPDNESGYHDASGTYGTGNYYGIGMEVCVDEFPGTYYGSEYTNWLNNKFKENCRRAALLTVELCKRHNMGDPGDCTLGTPIRQHWDSNEKNCPEQMRFNTSTGTYSRDNGDMWKYYVSYVQKYWQEINGGSSDTVVTTEPNKNTDITIPEYLKADGEFYRVISVAPAAFKGKKNLVRLALPATIESGFTNTAFEGSSKLEAVNVAKGSSYIRSQYGKFVFYDTSSTPYTFVTLTPEAYKSSSAATVAAGVTLKSTALYTTVSVIGDKDYEPYVTLFMTKPGSSVKVDFAGQIIDKVSPGMTVAELRAQFAYTSKMVFMDWYESVLSEQSKLGTGMFVSDVDSNGRTVKLTVMIRADLDGDGQVEINDYTYLKSRFKNKITLEEPFEKAADANADGSITVSDYIMIKRLASGTLTGK